VYTSFWDILYIPKISGMLPTVKEKSNLVFCVQSYTEISDVNKRSKQGISGRINNAYFPNAQISSDTNIVFLLLHLGKAMSL
jgi:hypothetical protein